MNAVLKGALAAALAAGLAGTAQAQQYPNRTVRIVAPFAPGGGTDFIARLLAKKFTESMGQSFIVDNRPGAGGNLGAEIAVKSTPDGYALLMISGSYTVNPSLYKVPFDSVKDIQAIIQLSQGPFLVAISPSVKATTLKEFVELAAKQPGKLAYSTAGAGSITHLATEYFMNMAKIEVIHVPYKGTAPAMQAVVAGDVQIIFGSAATTLSQVTAGKMRALAVTTPKRIPGAPNVPTVMEAGWPEYEAVLWHGLVGPKGIPRPIVDKLNKEANVVIQDKEVMNILAQEGVAPAGGTPDQFIKVIASDIQRWAKVVKQAKVTVE